MLTGHPRSWLQLEDWPCLRIMACFSSCNCFCNAVRTGSFSNTLSNFEKICFCFGTIKLLLPTFAAIFACNYLTVSIKVEFLAINWDIVTGYRYALDSSILFIRGDYFHPCSFCKKCFSFYYTFVRFLLLSFRFKRE